MKDIWDIFVNGQKILGMNSRNLRYIKPYNKKKWVRLVDDKIAFKLLLEKYNIPTPKLLGVIASTDELQNFSFESLPKSFVLKPRSGFGGEGIVVIFGEHKKRAESGERIWVKGRGKKISEGDIKNHIRDILDGSFSRTGTADVAFFEERIQISKTLKPYSYKGIPDIRVIVFNRIPVMAMIRLPTEHSAGKANLHQGGIGVGIDIATGVTTNAVYKDHFIDEVPGKRLKLSGLKIPYWEKVLETAIRTADVTNVGYNGVDIAIDRDKGPVVLEANARPGLSIQIANLAPLKERLEKVKGLKVKGIKRPIRIAQDLFGGEIQEEVEEITGRTMIGLQESVTLTSVHGKEITIDCKVDTGADSSSIDADLVKELGFGQVFTEFEELDIPNDVTYGKLNKITDLINKDLKKSPDKLLKKIVIVKSGNGYTIRPYIALLITIKGTSIKSMCSIVDRSHMKYRFLLGKKDMKEFIIDPLKK
jgi:alpha-L-glutamate ligase-like protein